MSIFTGLTTLKKKFHFDGLGEMKMKIKLNDKFQITGIPMNFVLEEKKINKKTQEEYWDTVGYYPNFESLLSGMLRHGVQASECEDVKLLIQEVKDGVRAIMEQIEVLER